jgi:DNA-binding NtrC family response regulator
VDVRVLAATNVDILSRIQAGQFRRDLYYRLNVIAVELPPLRERGDDVLLLAGHYLQKYARNMQRPPKRLGPDAVRALCDYDWPGNVRELEHAIEHAMILSQRDVIPASDLPFTRFAGALREAPTAPGLGPLAARRAESPLPMGSAAAAADPPHGTHAELAELPYAEAKRRLLARFDDMYTAEALRLTGGNMSEAARRAGLDRSNFRRLLRKRKEDP